MGVAHSKVDPLRSLKDEYDKQIQRQTVVADHYFQRKLAHHNSLRQERLLWEGIVGGVVSFGLFVLSQKKKGAFLPAIPIVMWFGFQLESCTLDFQNAVQKRANGILADPVYKNSVSLVGGPITLEELDKRRQNWSTKFIVD